MVVLTHLLNLRSEFRELSPGLVRAMLAFNMPLFTFLSGYVVFGREGSSPWRFMRGKVLGLLVPYMAWVAVVMPIRHIPVSGWLPRLGRALVDPHAGFQMWYLWVLFVLYGVFVAARAVSRSELWLGLTALAAAAALALVAVPTTFGIDKLVWLYPFLIAGYLAARYRDALRRHDRVIGLTGLFAFPVLLSVGTGSAPLRFAVAIAGIMAAWAIYRVLPKSALHWQAWAGRRTLGVYGWQMIVLPYLLIGTGWIGAAASWAAIVGASLVLTVGLERLALTRALFLGQWPKTRPSVVRAPAPEPVLVTDEE